MRFQILLTVAFVLMAGVCQLSEAISCYNCGDCNNQEAKYVDCSDVVGLDLHSKTCMRSRTESGVVSRSCGVTQIQDIADQYGLESGCVHAPGTGTVCICETDGCNNSDDWNESPDYDSGAGGSSSYGGSSYSDSGSDYEYTYTSSGGGGSYAYAGFGGIIFLPIGICWCCCRNKRNAAAQGGNRRAVQLTVAGRPSSAPHRRLEETGGPSTDQPAHDHLAAQRFKSAKGAEPAANLPSYSEACETGKPMEKPTDINVSATNQTEAPTSDNRGGQSLTLPEVVVPGEEKGGVRTDGQDCYVSW